MLIRTGRTLALLTASCAWPVLACAAPPAAQGTAAGSRPSALEAPASPSTAGAAGKDGAQAIVLGEGATPSEAEAWVRRWEGAVVFHGKLFRLRKGYPRVARSDELPGLEPGSHVTLLGVCPGADVASRLDFVRSFFPGAQAHPVGVPADACPAMPLRTTLAASQRVEKGGRRIVANLYFSPQDEEDDPEAWRKARAAGGSGPGVYRLRTGAFDASGKLYHHVDERVLPAERDPSTGITLICKVKLGGGGGRIVLDQACDEQDPPACTGRTTHLVARTTYDFEGTAIREKTDVLEERVSKHCD